MKLKQNLSGRSGRFVTAAIVGAMVGAMVGVLGLTFGISPASLAFAQGQTSEQVAEEIIRLKAQADATAQAWGEAESQAGVLGVELTAAQLQVDQASAAKAAMQQTMSAIAIGRYTQGGTSSLVFMTGDPLSTGQIENLSKIAVAGGSVSVDEYEQLQGDLAAKQASLKKLKDRNESVAKQLQQRQADLEGQLAQLETLRLKLKDDEVRPRL